MTPAAPSVGPSERAIADAIRYRSMLGLRNDEAYVRRLAADPEAVALGTRSIGFPATQDEIDLVEARARASDEVIRIVREYAEDHPDTWADLYIDTPTGTVFAQFTAELDQHRAALAKLLHPDARLELRLVRWSHRELTELRNQVRREDGWFESIGAELVGNGVDITSNRVELWVRTNRDGVIPLVLEHFGALDRMTVQFAGGIWTGGFGELVVVARDPSGRPVANLDCLVDPDDPDAIQGSELFTTDEAGRCRFPNTPADDVTIFLDGIAGEPVQWNGTARARVPAGESITVEVTVSRADR